jgi:hypothetical protein
MATQDVFRTMIVPAGFDRLAQRIAQTVAPVAGAGMWVVGLSENGHAPATHYVSTGFVGREWQLVMPCQSWALVDGTWKQTGAYGGDAGQLMAYLQTSNPHHGLTVEQVQALFREADVTEQACEVAYERLGLQLVLDPFEDPL